MTFEKMNEKQKTPKTLRIFKIIGGIFLIIIGIILITIGILIIIIGILGILVPTVIADRTIPEKIAFAIIGVSCVLAGIRALLEADFKIRELKNSNKDENHID